MPTSPWDSIPTIFDIVMSLEPRPTRVLDVGIGYGKFGFLAREYLTFWNSPESVRRVQVDGVEAFAGYVGTLQEQIYDHVFLGDARDVLPTLDTDAYDLVLMIDVLEHFEKGAGRKVVQECCRVGKAVVISTPRQFWHQDDSWGNPFETHLSLWSKRDLLEAGAVRVAGKENWIATFARAPYRERFTRRYELWSIGNRYCPSWLRPVAHWGWRQVRTIL
ncbi:MAG TPA: class I SAM-dependent methyltransferase [Pyrinomonadaceae bacterium]|nr:class I SAM-dependent methyltransferase [Pyrinomonadaceae bacterium]